MTRPAELHVLLVDPSLFTAPYDAALTWGLVSAGVRPIWAVRGLRRGDHQAIPLEFSDPFFYRLVDEMNYLPGRVRALAKGMSHIAGLAGLIARVALRKPDVVHFQWAVLPLIDGLAVAIIRRMCPVVFTVHDTVPYNGDGHLRWQARALGSVFRQVDQLVVHTRAGRQALLARGIDPQKVTVIPHGPLCLNSPIPPRNADIVTPWTFVLFGELKFYKGLDILVEAVGLLPRELVERARFLVAGKPVMPLDDVKRRIEDLRIGAFFEIRPGRLSDEQMARLFSEADCFLLPYRQIDASGVFFLIRSLNKWIIASNIGIFAEDLADGKLGALVPPCDPLALAEALAQAIRQRPAVTEKASTPDWDEIGAMTASVYRRLLDVSSRQQPRETSRQRSRSSKSSHRAYNGNSQ